MINDWNDLDTALLSHDWYYMMSDDFRYYTSGQNSWDLIINVLPKFACEDIIRTRDLINKYSPDPVDTQWLYDNFVAGRDA
jgi:hypothetical protein